MGIEARKQELEGLIKRARLSAREYGVPMILYRYEGKTSIQPGALLATVSCEGFVALEKDVEKILEDKA